MSAFSLSKMRSKAIVVLVLGSSFITLCRGLRIPLIFQLTMCNILTAEREVAKKPRQVSRIRFRRAFAQAFACISRKGLTYVGRGFKFFGSHWLEQSTLKGWALGDI